MNAATIAALAATLLVPSAPPILPFTEISDAKVDTACRHIVAADECTVTDLNVVLQLDHIRWKYNTMRAALYKAAGDAADGATVNAKDLGKMFDTIDSALDVQREKDLQKARKAVEEAERKAPRRGET